MIKYQFVFAFLFFSVWMGAQNSDPTIISTAGGSDSKAQVQLNWTIGEIAIQTGFSDDIIITEGFQQPTLEFNEIVENNLSLDASTQFKVALSPNPVQTVLNVNLQSETEGEVYLSLFNLQGASPIDQFKKDANDDFQLDMQHLPSGIYFLRCFDAEQQLIKTYRIIKH